MVSSVRCDFCGHDYYVFYAEVNEDHLYSLMPYIYCMYMSVFTFCCVFYHLQIIVQVCILCVWCVVRSMVPYTFPLYGPFHRPWGVSELSTALFMLDLMWPVAVVRVLRTNTHVRVCRKVGWCV